MAIDDNASYELTGYQVKDLAQKIRAKADSASLASVATSGLYSDLTGAPTIPTVYNGALTIQQNGTTVDTFTANSSTNKTVNIETITAETVAPAEEVGAITSSMIDWSTMPGSYSTTEQKTPFTWIDGKPIYKKTINFGNLPNATAKQVSHGITNMARVVKIEGIIQMNSTLWTATPLVYKGVDSTYNAEFQVSTTYVHCANSQDRSNLSAIVTIWYTKTTD